MDTFKHNEAGRHITIGMSRTGSDVINECDKNLFPDLSGVLFFFLNGETVLQGMGAIKRRTGSKKKQRTKNREEVMPNIFKYMSNIP